MDLSRTASTFWTLFSSRARREVLVWEIGVGFGMREVRDCVLWAGGVASLAVAAVWERVFRASVSVGSEKGWQGV